jgi:threonyl-tRNA synthetase
VDLDDRTESVGKKIRDGELRKVPYMLIVGDQEQADGTVAVRRHREGDLGATPVGDFIASLSAAILARE